MESPSHYWKLFENRVVNSHIAHGFDASQPHLNAPLQVCSIAACGPGYRPTITMSAIGTVPDIHKIEDGTDINALIFFKAATGMHR